MGARPGAREFRLWDRIQGVLRMSLSCALISGGVAQAAIERPVSPDGAAETIEAIEIGAVKAGTGGLLLSGQAGGSVDGALTWSLAGRDAAGRIDVPFVVEVEGGALLAGDEGPNIAIGIYAYVVDGQGMVVEHIAQGLILEERSYRESILASGLKFIGRFNLEPGDYTLRVMVQNNGTSEYFMSWSLLSLPSADDSSPQLLPPLFTDPGSNWIVARQQGEAVPFNVLTGGHSLPAAMPTMVANQPTELYLGGSDLDETAVIQMRIVNAVGRVVSEPLASLVEPASGDFRFRRIVLSPIDLPPGRYSMRLTVADVSGGEILQRATRLAVVGEGSQRAWYAIGESAGAAPAREHVVSPESIKKIKKKEIRAAYRETLRPLGDGDTVTARRRVAEFERRMTADASQSAVRSLAEAEIEEARSLAKVSPASLMPLALLHRDLYRSYELRREGLLAVHARNMAITYAELLGRSASQPGFSEGLMVNFAFDLAGIGALSAARGLLRRALQFDPGYRPALLSLGFSFEQGSQYQEAAEVYRTLVETHPEFDEGRLRLAVNLMRTGREEAGKAMLRALLEAGDETWIEVVAAQELVRHLAVKQSSLPEAEREARAALARRPDDQRLWILLAAILVRLDRHEEAMTVLGNLPRPNRSMSPRARYTEWPALDVRASGAFLTAQAEEALPALREALVERGGEG